MPHPRYSVIIPVRNGAATLDACLEALEDQTVPRDAYEIIVVNDGSTDATAEVLRRRAVQVLETAGRGAAAARNRGFQVVRGEIVLFLDADCRPTSDWIARMVAPLEAGEADGTVGRFVSRQSNWVARLIQLEHDQRYRRMARFQWTDFVNTATCAFRRAVLPDPPFCEEFAKLEDLDLSFRLAEAGVKLRYLPDTVVEHRHPESLGHYLRRRFRYGRYAPALYRRHASKLAGDTSTPQLRRLQLVLLGLAPFGFLWGPYFGLGLVAASVACSAPFLWQVAWRYPLLVPGAVAFSLAGNVCFVAGALTGMLTRGGERQRLRVSTVEGGGPHAPRL
ncbi:MAG: hypothetical protein Kow00109_22060 [Acidobacteriota bacterium]